jgi:hypothetical protein
MNEQLSLSDLSCVNYGLNWPWLARITPILIDATVDPLYQLPITNYQMASSK